MIIPFNNVRKTFLRIFGAQIGRQVYLGYGCEIRKPRNLIIGNNVVINPKCLIDCRGGALVIGNNVDIAQESIIWTESHDPHDAFHKLINASTTIEDYCWVGCRSMIMPGVTLGYGSVVAAGSIVTKNVGAKEIVGGIPARLISMRRSELKYILRYSPYFA